MTLREDSEGRKGGNVKGGQAGQGQKPPMPRLVLLDANHLMHRAYWAVQRNLTTSKGEQTNAVFGVASMLLTLLPREQPDRIIACFDEGKETFRHKDHAAYKAGRPETPEDFYTQIPRVRECLATFSIPLLSDPRFEADDLLATLAMEGVKEGFAVVIVTGDRDLFQMASDRIHIAIPEQGYAEPLYLDAQGVEAKLGIRPSQVPDYKGLTGDPSDNLKGVRGIGPKTATALLKEYGSLEEIYAHLPEIRENVRLKLEADRESAFTCKRLATLVTDVPLPSTLHTTAPWKASGEDIDRFFAELEFHTLRRRFRQLRIEDPSLQSRIVGEDTALLPHDEGAQEDASGGVGVTQGELPILD